MVSCGGEQKKKEETKQTGEQKIEQTGEQKTEQTGEQETEQLTIAQLFDTMYDALQNGDMERFIELAIITDEWGDELTPEQEKELEAYFQKSPEKLMAVMEAIENIDFDEYIDEIAYPENGYEEDYGYAVEDCGCAVENYGYAVEDCGCAVEDYGYEEDYGYADEDYGYDDEWSDEEEW